MSCGAVLVFRQNAPLLRSSPQPCMALMAQDGRPILHRDGQVFPPEEVAEALASFCSAGRFSLQMTFASGVLHADDKAMLHSVPFCDAESILLQSSVNHLDDIVDVFQESALLHQTERLAAECIVCCGRGESVVAVHKYQNSNCSVKMCSACIDRVKADKGGVCYR